MRWANKSVQDLNYNFFFNFFLCPRDSRAAFESALFAARDSVGTLGPGQGNY